MPRAAAPSLFADWEEERPFSPSGICQRVITASGVKQAPWISDIADGRWTSGSTAEEPSFLCSGAQDQVARRGRVSARTCYVVRSGWEGARRGQSRGKEARAALAPLVCAASSP